MHRFASKKSMAASGFFPEPAPENMSERETRFVSRIRDLFTLTFVQIPIKKVPSFTKSGADSYSQAIRRKSLGELTQLALEIS